MLVYIDLKCVDENFATENIIKDFKSILSIFRHGFPMKQLKLILKCKGLYCIEFFLHGKWGNEKLKAHFQVFIQVN